MGLQFIFGGSGAGKSTLVFEKVIAQSMQNPTKNYFLMVPDQFTMYTQKEICSLHPRGGIMNIDVLSFSRLIHRIADEVGQKEKSVLDDTGKNLILRKVAQHKEEELVLLKAKLKRPGYIHEVKSMLSEFYQYDIGLEDLDEMIALSEKKGALSYKLKDLRLLFEGFQAYIQEKYITTEEALDHLCGMIPKSSLLRDSVIVFDGFTGFTPIQNRVIMELLGVAEEVLVTLCADHEKDILTEGGQQRLFALSKKTYDALRSRAEKQQITVRESIFLMEKPVKRYADNEAMAFLEAELFRYRQNTFEKEQDRIAVWEADTPLREVQRVCLEIKRLVREEDYCYRDISVVTGDLGRYAHLVETEFARYGIPCFLDQNRGVAYHPMTEYLKGALGIIKDHFSYESVFRFLRCGLSSLTLDEVDRLENYVTSFGIRGRRIYEGTFVKGTHLEEMNRIRECFVQELSPLLVKCASAKEYTMAVYALCERAGLQKKCNAYAQHFTERGELSKAKEYEKIYVACMDLLNQIYELIGDDAMDVEEFIQIFEAGISEIQIGTIPQNADQVVVGDMERTRLKKIKALFFLGVNDGIIPGKGGSGGLLSDMEREFLIESGRELAPTPRQKIFEQRLYLYQNMTKPTERLYLSYVKVDGSGKSALPSYLIRVLCGLFPNLQISSDDDRKEGNLAKIATKEDGLDDLAYLLRVFMNQETAEEESRQVEKDLEILYKAYREMEADSELENAIAHIHRASTLSYKPKPLSKEVTELLYEDRGKGSVSRLELFASCAYAHFLRYGLELTEKREYEFGAIDFGTVYHGVLEQFSRQLQEKTLSLKDISPQQVDEMTEQALQIYAEQYGESILYSSERNVYRIRQMQEVLKRSIKTMQYQLKKGSFEPAYFEQKFRMKGALGLIGKIDRIDISREEGETYIKVIDYKSGAKKFSVDELFYGLSMQLPVYMNAAISMLMERYPQETILPAAMLYYRLQSPFISQDELSKEAVQAQGPEVEKLAQQLRKQEIEACLYKKMKPDGLLVESDTVIRCLDHAFETDSDVISVGKKKDGSLKSASQTMPKEQFDLLLDYAEVKAEQLMEQMLAGDIAVRPVAVEKAGFESCAYCRYHTICRMDERISGYSVTKLNALSEEEREEAMRDAVHRGSAEGHNREK